MIVRYVQPLTQEQRQLLEHNDERRPLLSSPEPRPWSVTECRKGRRSRTIAKTYQVHRVTVSAWIKKWEQHGAQSLHDQPRSGRPSKLTPEERDIAQQYIKEEPHALKQVGAL